MTVQIKICGITSITDAQSACALGSDYIGIVVDIAGSSRSVTTKKAAEICSGIPRPVLLMEGSATVIRAALRQIKPYAVQLIGPYTADDMTGIKEDTGVQIWKPFHVPPKDETHGSDLARQIDGLDRSLIDAVILDTLIPGHKGGTGRTCDWKTAATIVRTCHMNVFLAGGLAPENVAQAITEVQPFGVDVSSGVESSPGNKDSKKISTFIQQAKAVQ
jgi:phosphoribosylanthranilate isomerase